MIGAYAGGGDAGETVFGVVLAISIGVSIVVSYFAVKWLEPSRKGLAIMFTVIMTAFMPFVILLLMPTDEARAVAKMLLFMPHPQFLAATRIAIALLFVLAWCGVEALSIGRFSLAGFFGGEDIQVGKKQLSEPVAGGPPTKARKPAPSRPRAEFGNRGQARRAAS
jgi:hypothetical protein